MLKKPHLLLLATVIGIRMEDADSANSLPSLQVVVKLEKSAS